MPAHSSFKNKVHSLSIKFPAGLTKGSSTLTGALSVFG